MSVKTTRKRKKATVNRFIRKIIVFFLNGEWSGLWNYIQTESVNIFHVYNLINRPKNLFCPICKYSAKSFEHLSNSQSISWNSACQNCNSRSRHRGLFFLYHDYLKSSKELKILHFAPEPILEGELRKYTNHRYFTTDYNMLEVDYLNEDIQQLSFDNSSFDLILINHVLEHVPNDKMALMELSRILKPRGVAIITIPGDWRKQLTIHFNHLGFNGHYRDYGLDIINIMKENFSLVSKRSLYIYNGKKHGIKPMETAFLCYK